MSVGVLSGGLPKPAILALRGLFAQSALMTISSRQSLISFVLIMIISGSPNLCVFASWREIFCSFFHQVVSLPTLPPLVIGFSNDQERFDGMSSGLHF
jgi:hypothetical protein